MSFDDIFDASFDRVQIPCGKRVSFFEAFYRQFNIKPYLYHLWFECLIDTVREFDPLFSDDVELAWRLTLSSGITYMKFGYDHF